MPADPAATPVGARNLACAPGPSVLPSSPVPATVLTVRDASVPIKRIRLLRVSAAITCPVAVTARPVGPENWAAGPGPSAGAAEPTTPAKASTDWAHWASVENSSGRSEPDGGSGRAARR